MDWPRKEILVQNERHLTLVPHVRALYFLGRGPKKNKNIRWGVSPAKKKQEEVLFGLKSWF